VLYQVRRAHPLASTGAYARVRHSQYIGKREEREMLAQFGDAYRRYREAVPAFIPKLASQCTVKGDLT
jgi:protein-S-isoprenylcysteine O-methyltransferase Ste14